MKTSIFMTQKKLGVLLMVAIFTMLIQPDSFAQKVQTQPEADSWQRAAIAFGNDLSDYEFSTPYGKACASILIQAHVSAFQYPRIITEEITGVDRKVVTDLLNELQQLRNAPPSWKEILSAEKSRFNAEFAPPSAPVFAGDVARESIGPDNHQNRLSNKTVTMKRIDLTQAPDDPSIVKEDPATNIADENE